MHPGDRPDGGAGVPERASEALFFGWRLRGVVFAFGALFAKIKRLEKQILTMVKFRMQVAQPDTISPKISPSALQSRGLFQTPASRPLAIGGGIPVGMMTVVLRTRIPIKMVMAEESGLPMSESAVSDGDEDLG